MIQTWEIKRIYEVESTNKRLWDLFLHGHAREGTVVMADMQKAGKCRNKKDNWESPWGGLYASFLVLGSSSLMPLKTAVAVCRGLEKLSFHPLIKWPNDILLDGKKICGILCESLFHEGKPVATVCGFGVNVNTDVAKGDLHDKAGSLLAVSHKEWDTRAVLESILSCWEMDDALKAYRYRCVTIGKHVMLEGEADPVIAAGLTDSGHLLVRDPLGVEREICAGEVSVRMPGGGYV